jgi:hypothetical protein
VLHLAHHLAEAAVELSDEVRRGHAHVLEEHLAEVAAAGHVRDGLDRDPGAAQVDHELGQPGVRRGVGIGAGDQVHVVGHRRARRPDLLAGDAEVVAVALGACADPGDVGPRVGLAHADRPHRRAVEDAGEVGPLLLRGAELQEGRTHLAVREP